VDVLFARPVGADVSLWRPPALEGRDGGYLDRLEQELGWSRRGEHLALALDAGLPPTVPVAGEGHDLDDYLFPVVERLGHVRFDAAFATKRHAHRSLIRVGPAAPPADALPAPQVRVRTTASATSIDWKEQVHDACRAATREPAPPGPVAVALRFTVSRRRNWTALWKPALQALGPILGVPDPAMPYRASAGRITSLALHRRWDDLVAHRVEVEVWWRPLT
jgi:hypothetical protein